MSFSTTLSEIYLYSVHRQHLLLNAALVRPRNGVAEAKANGKCLEVGGDVAAIYCVEFRIRQRADFRFDTHDTAPWVELCGHRHHASLAAERGSWFTSL